MTASKTSWRTAAVAVGTGLALAFSSPALAGADDDFARLLQLNPGVSAQELKDSAMEYAASAGITYEEALSQARAEAEAHIGENSAGGCTRKVIGAGDRQGDVFYSPSSTGGVEHGHVGLYSSEERITEAPGTNKKSGTFDVARREYCVNVSKMHVDTSSANLGKVSGFAEDHLTGQTYDLKFAFNKDDGIGWLNCSELVWKAFHHSVGLDLDGDGGTSVFPKDILDSSKTSTYATVN
jgi:uncharacterized protein YycO